MKGIWREPKIVNSPFMILLETWPTFAVLFVIALLAGGVLWHYFQG
jgi:hypothetical protein